MSGGDLRPLFRDVVPAKQKLTEVFQTKGKLSSPTYIGGKKAGSTVFLYFRLYCIID